MGNYVNIGNAGFAAAVRETYVDKTELISFINSTLGTKRKLTCVSRPRRFGKSYAAQMLCAYYDKSCDSRELFQDLKIAGDSMFEDFLNKFDVIYLDITWFISIVKNVRDVVCYLQEQVISELRSVYTAVKKETSLPIVLAQIAEMTGHRFIIIIDEWDVLIRDEVKKADVQEQYINFLRGLFKGTQPTKFLHLAYLTGILPIKKMKTQSALNNFDEFTMLDAKVLAPYIGFTTKEVRQLCAQYHRDFEEVQRWYDGYSISEEHVYNPQAVVSVMMWGEFQSYWSMTGTY